MKKNKAIGVVVAIALFLGLLTYTTAVGFGPTGTGAAKNITLGLDLSGGVSITYEVVGDENPSAEDMKDTIYKLQKLTATAQKHRFTRKVLTVSTSKSLVYPMQIPFLKNLANQVPFSSSWKTALLS